MPTHYFISIKTNCRFCLYVKSIQTSDSHCHALENLWAELIPTGNEINNTELVQLKKENVCSMCLVNLLNDCGVFILYGISLHQ